MVEFVGLSSWLWDSLKDLASRLGTPLFGLTKRGMGIKSNRVFIGWVINATPPRNMVMNARASCKVIPLQFGTFFRASFECNKLGHFVKDFPTIQGGKEPHKQ